MIEHGFLIGAAAVDALGVAEDRREELQDMTEEKRDMRASTRAFRGSGEAALIIDKHQVADFIGLGGELVPSAASEFYKLVLRCVPGS